MLLHHFFLSSLRTEFGPFTDDRPDRGTNNQSTVPEEMFFMGAAHLLTSGAQMFFPPFTGNIRISVTQKKKSTKKKFPNFFVLYFVLWLVRMLQRVGSPSMVTPAILQPAQGGQGRG